MGPEAPDTIEIAWKLGVVDTELGQAAEGEALLAPIIAPTRKMVPQGHPMLGALLLSWGECLSRLDRNEEARDALSEAYEILQGADGTREGEEARKAATLLEGVHRALGKAQEADRWAALGQAPTDD